MTPADLSVTLQCVAREIVEIIAAEWKPVRDAIASLNCVALARQIGDLAAGWR